MSAKLCAQRTRVPTRRNALRQMYRHSDTIRRLRTKYTTTFCAGAYTVHNIRAPRVGVVAARVRARSHNSVWTMRAASYATTPRRENLLINCVPTAWRVPRVCAGCTGAVRKPVPMIVCPAALARRAKKPLRLQHSSSSLQPPPPLRGSTHSSQHAQRTNAASVRSSVYDERPLGYFNYFYDL